MEANGAPRLVGLRIAAADLAAAGAYDVLLGPPSERSEEAVRFELGTGVVEVVAGPAGAPVLLVASAEVLPALDLPGLALARARPGSGAHRPSAAPPAVAIDHIVVTTVRPERAITAWRDRMGFRLALDRAFPERGLRMLFFRSGGITLEVTSPLGENPSDAPDAIFGIAYRVGDLDECRRRLAAAGLDVSEVRAGRKPGTNVATVRGGTAGVPTLLVRDPSRDATDHRPAQAG